jgi:paraquat-inducible protein A
MLVITLAARRPLIPHWLAYPLHWSHEQQKWAMLEVMMVAVLISMIKLSDYAMIIPGVASYAMGALIVLLTIIKTTFSPETIWNRMEWQIKPPLPGEYTAMPISSEGKD